MTLERLDRKKTHLRRPYDDNDRGGGAYCGEMCFGFGEQATSDKSKATCHMCSSALRMQELRERNPLDQFVREVNRDQPGLKS